MRTVLELTLLFSLAIVSVCYAYARDELLALKLKCHEYGYAKVNVTEHGAISSITLKPPHKVKPILLEEPDQAHFVKIEPATFQSFDR